MAFPDAHLDVPAHPLGLRFHPNWQAVRDAQAERECNLIRRQAIENAARARREKTAAALSCLDWYGVVTALQLVVCCGFVACFWWALA